MLVAPAETAKQKVTVRLDRQTLHKAKILAAKRNTSISGLLAQEIEHLISQDDAYEQARSQAMTLLDQGFHLGGKLTAGRDELHER
jgi:hypothetical protein